MILAVRYYIRRSYYGKRMIFTCSNLRNKKCNIKVDGEKVYLNEEELKIQTVGLIECSLTKEYVNVVLLLSEKYKKKTELFLEYSWLHNNKKMEDEERVEKANKDCTVLFDKIACFFKCDSNTENTFEGRFDGTYDMSTIYNAGLFLVAPSTKTILHFTKIKSVFFERMASYQKNFDLTLGLKDDTVISIYTINRKKFYKVVKEMFKEWEQYEGGPDPLPWPTILRTMQSEKLNWKQVADLFIGSEEADDEVGCSDWAEESEEEDEEDDDAEFDELVDEDEEEDEIEEVSEDDDDDEEEEEEEESDSFDIMNFMSNSPKKRKYDSDSTNEIEPKKTKIII